MTATNTISPYLMEEPPTSTGKALLSRCLEHWCALHHGHDPEEIAAAFEKDDALDASVRQQVTDCARLMGELMAAGRMRTYARPIGGGTPLPLKPDDWELDDFRPRFARSAMDPSKPFDTSSPPTHWVFVELEDFNQLVEASCAEVMPKGARRTSKAPDCGTALANGSAVPTIDDRHIRMPEIKRRTGMSASTVYRRIEQGRFPKQIPMSGGNIAAWWESEVAEWLASPR